MTACVVWIRVCIGGGHMRNAVEVFKSTGILGFGVWGLFLFALVTLVTGYLGGALSLSGAMSCALTFAISDAAMLLAWARLTGKLKARR